MRYALLAVLFLSAFAGADQPNPTLFVKAESSYKTSGGFFHSSTSHKDQGITAIDFFQRGCQGLTVTMDESKADFVFQMNHQDEGGFGIGNETQGLLSKHDGTLIKTFRTRSLMGAANNVCKEVTGEKLDFRKRASRE